MNRLYQKPGDLNCFSLSLASMLDIPEPPNFIWPDGNPTQENWGDMYRDYLKTNHDISLFSYYQNLYNAKSLVTEKIILVGRQINPWWDHTPYHAVVGLLEKGLRGVRIIHNPLKWPSCRFSADKDGNFWIFRAIKGLQ